MPAVLSLDLAHRLPAAWNGVLVQVGAAARDRQSPAYLVGGVVRDLLLGLEPDDGDIVVEGSAPALAQALQRTAGGRVRVHAPFGTATWTTPAGLTVDLASARTETYVRPGALPTVVVPATLLQDLGRRDFSVNAMAVRLDGPRSGEVVDPWAGQDDLAARIIRVLHVRSFVDDPTRIFRAARYAGRLGFTVAADTLALLPEAWPVLSSVSADRLRHELDLVFREPQAAQILAELESWGALRQTHPALRWTASAADAAARIPELPWARWQITPPPVEVLYGTLLLAEADPAAQVEALHYLNWKRSVTEAVRTALALTLPVGQPSAVVAVLDGIGEWACAAAYVRRPAAVLDQYLQVWRRVRPTLTGTDLVARGLRPGPEFKRILWEARAAWLDGVIGSPVEEKVWLEQHLKNRQ